MMIWKIILFVLMFFLAFIAQGFFKINWALPLAFFIIFLYIAIKIIRRILRRRGGSSSNDGDDVGRYFGGLFEE
jgi:membrane protein implicated in regulation of membrane protease activity